MSTWMKIASVPEPPARPEAFRDREPGAADPGFRLRDDMRGDVAAGDPRSGRDPSSAYPEREAVARQEVGRLRPPSDGPSSDPAAPPGAVPPDPIGVRIPAQPGPHARRPTARPVPRAAHAPPTGPTGREPGRSESPRISQGLGAAQRPVRTDPPGFPASSAEPEDPAGRIGPLRTPGPAEGPGRPRPPAAPGEAAPPEHSGSPVRLGVPGRPSSPVEAGAAKPPAPPATRIRPEGPVAAPPGQGDGVAPTGSPARLGGAQPERPGVARPAPGEHSTLSGGTRLTPGEPPVHLGGPPPAPGEPPVHLGGSPPTPGEPPVHLGGSPRTPGEPPVSLGGPPRTPAEPPVRLGGSPPSSGEHSTQPGGSRPAPGGQRVPFGGEPAVPTGGVTPVDSTTPVPGRTVPLSGGAGAPGVEPTPRVFLDTVEATFHDLIGGSVPGPAARSLWSRMSSEQQVAFLLHPLEARARIPFPSPPPGAGEGLGRGDALASDALLSAFDGLLLDAPSPSEVSRFFARLTPRQLDLLALARAPRLGNLAGVPPDVRFASNLRRLAADWVRASAAGGQAAAQHAAALRDLLVPGAQPLAYVPAPPTEHGGTLDGAARGHLAWVLGDLDAAPQVTFLLPGQGDPSSIARQSMALQDQLRATGGEAGAIVSSLGFGAGAPAAGREDPAARWLEGMLEQRDQAVKQVRELISGLLLPSGVRTTFVGYSWGNTLVKELVKSPGIRADAIILLGAPRQELRRIARGLEGQPTDLYGNESAGEPVEPIEEDWLAALAKAEKALEASEAATLGPAVEGELIEDPESHLAAGSPELARVAAIVCAA